MDFNQLIIYKQTTPERPAMYADYPDSLHPDIAGYLASHEVKKLYAHQAEMFEQAQQDKNIVITTSTASGKTLSFLLPVLQEILHNPLARAIFLYPTKALAADQYRAIQPYIQYFGENRISAGVYDGDTTPSERSRIRKTANIILTNPEMLNGAFLPNHSKYGFDFIFSNLKYVVIDELHTYRGIFGSHVANVFRRLNRVCGYYNSSPQFLCSSATIANPLELAREICGKDFIQIDKDGSPAAKRNYYLIQPPRIEDNKKNFVGQVQGTTIAAEMVSDLVEHDHSFIAFTKSRKNVEVVLRESRDKLAAEAFLGYSYADKVSGYRGGYTPMERKQIEHKMISGELSGLVSTNALELGIDIGKVDTTILVGFPGTRASFWQQTGRAGRSGMECNNYLILESLPQDQYIGVNPDWLFAGSNENAVVDKNNLLIQLAHIRAAAAELPLTLNDIAIFPDLGETIPVLLRVEELKSQNGKFVWSGTAFPAGDFNLRNMEKNRYKLMNKETNREITEMDETQAFRELHDGAIYLHDGMQYQVVELNLELKTAYALPYKGDYYTEPSGITEIKIIKQHKEQIYGRSRIFFGDINVNDVVWMYKKLQFHNHQNLGYEKLNKPLCKDYDTESTWISIPENVVTVYRRLLQVNSDGYLVRNNHFDGLCHAIKTATIMTTMTEKEDIGVQMSTNAIGINQIEPGEVYLFIYDKFVGGLGYAQKAYDLIEQIIQNAISLVSECSCKTGCTACIGDYKLDRSIVIWGLKSLLEELAAPKEQKYVEYAERSAIQKRFQFEELPEKWSEFCSYMMETGEQLSAFLTTISHVTVQDGTITLYTEQAFYKSWILEENNLRSLLNIFKFYTQSPVPIQIAIEVTDEASESDLKEKLQKRYRTLTD